MFFGRATGCAAQKPDPGYSQALVSMTSPQVPQSAASRFANSFQKDSPPPLPQNRAVIREELLSILSEQPLVVSVQDTEGAATDDTEALLRMAQASVAQGIHILRLEGASRVKRIREETGAFAIGLIKRRYPGRPAYITPTELEVTELWATDCEVIAVDATAQNPTAPKLIAKIKKAGRLAMADCDTVESALAAIE